MIIDLDQHAPHGSVKCDVAIVGGGTAGVITACELAARGRSVVVLESGGMTQTAETHPLNRVVQTGQEYRGAEHGRFRCLGGTSTRWGGAMIPFQPADFEADLSVGRPPWPIAHGELLRHTEQVERLFGLPAGNYDAAEDEARLGIPEGEMADTPAFRLRSPKWPAFARRNVAQVLQRELAAPRGPQVWINSTVTAIRLGEDGRVSRLRAQGGADAVVDIVPTETVIAAGAIESTRLLLKLDADYGQRLFGRWDVIGRYFHDHLSAPVARIDVRNPGQMSRLAGFRFQDTGMRNLRFETNPDIIDRLPGAFVHIAFHSDKPGGFDGVRDVYRALQRRELPSGRSLALVARHADWLLRAGWSRYVDRRVLPPDDAVHEATLVVEQVPVAGNRITLMAGSEDRFGVPAAAIHWRVSEQDLDNAGRVLDAFTRFWSRTGLASIGQLGVREAANWREALTLCGGIYHPGGTLRMGLSSSDAVVGADLSTFAVPNLRVLSTATFPTGGSANPTMMLMLMAMRMAEKLVCATT
jgi:choline dehydrogenase-like flavoprotein